MASGYHTGDHSSRKLISVTAVSIMCPCYSIHQILGSQIKTIW